MKKVLGYYFLLMSSIIGAGLITGQEIVSFFGGFNIKTCFAITFSSILIGVLIYKSLSASKSKDYQKIKENKFYKIFVVLSCVIVSSAMVAGVNEFAIRTTLPPFLSVVSLILAALFGSKLSGFFKKFSKIICILIIVAFCVLVIQTGLHNSGFVMVKGTHTFVKCFCYAAFNVFLLMPLAEECGVDLSKKQRILLSIFIAISLCVFLILGCYASSFVGGTMPLITAASKTGWFYWIYVVMAFLAILTTLFSGLYSIKQVCGKKIVLYLFMVALIYVISLFGFEGIIDYFYLIIGVIGSMVLLST